MLQRRKSRQSNLAPCVIDVDYAGDSGMFSHMIKQRRDQGHPNKQQLDFELNMRNYKNINNFYVQKPFVFPTVKHFSPERQWHQRKADVSQLNQCFKDKYVDKFEEKNINSLEYIMESKSALISTIKWQCNLRDLKSFKKVGKVAPLKDKN